MQVEVRWERVCRASYNSRLINGAEVRKKEKGEEEEEEEGEGKEQRGGMGRLWDLVMKFVGEFGGYGDTSFHPISILVSTVLLSSFNAPTWRTKKRRSWNWGKERGKGVRWGEPTNAAISSSFFHRLDFFP